MEENQEKKINTNKALAEIKVAFKEVDLNRAAEILAIKTYLFMNWLKDHPKFRKGL